MPGESRSVIASAPWTGDWASDRGVLTGLLDDPADSDLGKKCKIPTIRLKPPDRDFKWVGASTQHAR